MNKPFEKDPTEQFMLFPNTIIDDLMPILPPPCFKIICLIYRKTKGWNKTVDQISFSQIMKGTGIKSSATVAKYLESLSQKEIIFRARGDDTWDANSYALNPQFDVSTLKNEVVSTLKNEVVSTLKNEDTKDNVNTLNISLEKKPSESAPFSVSTEDVDYTCLDAAVAEAAALKLDAQIMGGEDELKDVFGENPRQDEIDAHQTVPRMTSEELLLASMGAGDPPEIRAKLAQIRDEGWQVRDSEVETALAQFFATTGFILPTMKTQRKLCEVGAREHLQEEHFRGQLWDLYKTVWSELEEDVANGLNITHPRAFTKSMYRVLNQRAGRDTSKGPAGGLTRNQVLHVFQNEGLVEVKEVDGTGKHDFFWTETGEPVGKKLPRDLISKHITSVQTENPGAR